MSLEASRPEVSGRLSVFLCHSTDDKPAVRNLWEKLNAERWVSPWLDEKNLLPGQDWNAEIERAVKKSDVVIVCLSEKSVKKEGYLQKEIRIAVRVADEKLPGRIFIIPLRLDNCAIPEDLSGCQAADLFAADGYQKLLRALLKASHSLAHLSPEPPPDALHDVSANPALPNEARPVEVQGQTPGVIPVERELRMRVNLGLLVVLGFVLLSWLWLFAGWRMAAVFFAVVPGTALLGYAIRPNAGKRWFEIGAIARAILLDRLCRTYIYCGALLAAVLSCFAGTVIVRSSEFTQQRRIVVRTGVGSSVQELSGLGTIRLLVWTSFFVPTTVTIEAQDLPGIRRSVYPWSFTYIRVPADLIRPVLLIRPSRYLMRATAPPEDAFRLEIERQDGQILRAAMDGRAVLVGAGTINIPEELLQLWRRELREAKAEAALGKWTRPATPFPDVFLKSGEKLLIRVYFPNGSPYESASTGVTIRVPSGADDILQDLLLP